jgi:hypothetical protein
MPINSQHGYTTDLDGRQLLSCVRSLYQLQDNREDLLLWRYFTGTDALT